MVQALCECWLVSGGPGLGELGGGEVAVGAVGSVVVVVDAPVLDEDLGFEEAVELPAVEELVAEPAVEGLDPGVLPGEPGSMKTVPTPLKRHQSATAAAMNSGPLSKRTKAGAPRVGDQPVEDGDDLVGVDGAVHDDGGALAGVLVDDVEQLQDAAVDGDVELEVHRPQGVRARSGTWPRRRCRCRGGASCACGRAP